MDLSAFDLDTIGERATVEVDDAALRLQEEAEYGKTERLRPVTMRLDDSLVRALKRIASRKGLSYQTLARVWLREKAIEEFRRSKRRAIA